MVNLGTGSGCPTTIFTNPEHNPKPTTERGKRRHAALDPGKKAHRERMWGAPRSITPSKKQQELMNVRSAASRKSSDNQK